MNGRIGFNVARRTNMNMRQRNQYVRPSTDLSLTNENVTIIAFYAIHKTWTIDLVLRPKWSTVPL